MAKYKTIKELVAAIRDGKVAEENLRVVMDNDCSSVYDESCTCTDGGYESIFHGEGYYDTEPLWKELLPKASVQWY